MKKLVRWSRLATFLTVLGSTAASNSHARFVENSKKTEAVDAEAVPSEFVVQLHSGDVSTQFFNTLKTDFSDFGVSVKENVSQDLGILRVRVENTRSLQNFAIQNLGVQRVRSSSLLDSDIRNMAIMALQSLPYVKFAEPNFIYRIQGSRDSLSAPNDPKFSSLWGLNNLGQKDTRSQEGVADADIDAPEVWQIEKGKKEIVVAIIDTGVDYTHPDLKANIWEMPGKPGVHGFNAINGKLDPMDDNDHGSHCAGTIGAEGDNNQGVVGVAWNVSLMGVKFLTSSGSGTLADAIKAIDWATAQNVDIMSNSWGGGGFSQALMDAISRANDKGILFVAAAGNESSDNDSSPAYPASYNLPNVISVAATDNRDVIASFSNWGFRSVHVMAPGVNILSTTTKNKYDSFSGTSMATPHVSGALALLLSKEGRLEPIKVRERLMNTSDKLKAYRKKIISAGRLNVDNLVRNVVPPGFVVIPGDAWKAPIAKKIATDHPYKSNEKKSWEISHPGATFLRVKFTRFDTEKGYDHLVIRDGQGNEVDKLSGNMGTDFWSFEIPGDSAKFEFTSDTSVQGWGFEIDSYSWTDFATGQP